MSEASLQRRVLRVLRAHGDAHKHVDAQAGVPDISYTLCGIERMTPQPGGGCWPVVSGAQSGWLELKWGYGWELRPEQRVWLKRRGQAGGTCHVLAQTLRDEYWLYWWREAVKRPVGFGTPLRDLAELPRLLREVRG